MHSTNLNAYLWVALAVLVLGSIYLIVQGYKVHRLFADSIVGKLVRALVVVFLIELYSLGVLSYAFIFFYPGRFCPVADCPALDCQPVVRHFCHPKREKGSYKFNVKIISGKIGKFKINYATVSTA